MALLKSDLPEIRCCIIGDGPEKETLLRLANEFGVRSDVDFAGFQAYEALIAKIKASKVLVLPSSGKCLGWL